MPYKKLSLEYFLQKKILFIIAAILTIIGALIVRLHGLGDTYYSSDEAWHLVIAGQKTFADVLDYNFKQEIHPPLSVLIWHLMLKISDNNIWMLSASYIPSILIIPSAFIFGSLLIGEAAGIVMALVAAFGFLPISTSVVIRAYPMMMLCLVWAGIFALKYRHEKLTKYLIFYFISMFLVLQLNHAAAFMAFILGTILMYDACKNKAIYALLSITLGHLILAAMTIGYGYILSRYYGFNVTYHQFVTCGSFTCYSFKIILPYYLILAKISNFFLVKSFGMQTILILITPIIIFQLLKNKKFILLHLIFTPLILIFIFDYFRIYPFYHQERSSLFLFLPAITLLGYIGQCIYYYIKNLLLLINESSVSTARESILKDKNVDILQSLLIILFNKIPRSYLSHNGLKILASVPIIAFPILLTLFRLDNDVRYSELEWNKKDMREAFKALNEFQVEGNILISENDSTWRLMLLENFDAEIIYITKYLGHFKSKNYDFYFTAFPGREYSKVHSLYWFSKFLSDLFSELKHQGKLSSVKNITYFNMGECGGFDKLVDLQLIPREKKHFIAEKYGEQLYEISKQENDLAWQIYLSDQVSGKLNKHLTFKQDDGTFRNTFYAISMTPKFIENNIISKNFIDWYEIKNKAALDFHSKPY